MRTTLTIDKDVEKLIDRLRKKEQISLKEAVNTALRRGLNELCAPGQPPPLFKTKTADLGACHLNRLDDIAEALALAEGERFR